MLPAISDFLKGAFSPDLLKALQPAGLVASAVFLLVNVLFIFPELVLRNVTPAVALLGLGTAWQAAIATGLVLLLAYLLLSLNNRILAVLTGEFWKDSPILGPALTWIQRRTRDQLQQSIERQTRGRGRQLTQFQLFTRFPTHQIDLMPTALGNVLNAVADDLTERYGIDFMAAWPRMETVIASENALAMRLNNERATLDFLVNLTFVLGLFAVENLVLRYAWRQWGLALLSIVFIVLAWLVYMAAIGKARAWGDAVGVAFDLYRQNLRTQLGMRDTKGRLSEKADWDALSKWVLFREANDDVLTNWNVPPTPVATATSSGNVTVSLQHAVVDERTPMAGPEQKVSVSKKILYLALLQNSTPNGTTSQQSSKAEGVYLTVLDTRLGKIDAQPKAEAVDWQGQAAPTATVIATGVPVPAYQVVWTILSVPAHGARLLRYSMPIYSVGLTCSAGLVVKDEMIQEAPTGSEQQRALRYRITLHNPGDNQVDNATLDVSDTRLTASASIRSGLLSTATSQTKLEAQRQDVGLYRWNIESLAAKTDATLVYDAVTGEQA
jgi:hypothetical protein